MTYVVLSLAVLVLVAVVTVKTLRQLPARPLVLTALTLMALTAIFDNVIVGLDIVAYADAKISGLRIWHAPVEDFAYALGAVMLMPAVWIWLGRVSAAASVARFMHVSDDTCEDANRGWRTFLWLNQPVGFLVTILLILIYQGWGATPSFRWA